MIRSVFGAALVAALSASASPALAEVPAGYPAEYNEVVAAAQNEGVLRLYTTTDEATARPMLDAFTAAYPGISIEYSNLNSTELYNRVISEAAANQAGYDVVWTGGMDTGLKLAADGYALEYLSPEAEHIPDWAQWNDTAYATNAEPLMFMYNKRILPADAVPQSHADLLRLVTEQPELFRGKVGMYDPVKTAGLTMNIYDSVNMPEFWDLISALKAVDLQLLTSSGSMMEKVHSGELAIIWNLFGSYGALQVIENPEGVGVVIPNDYVLTSSRIAFIGKDAQSPNAAKLFLDFLLSEKGQEFMANEGRLYAIRDGVTGEFTLEHVIQQVGDAVRPIPVSDDLLERVMDPDNRLAFIQKFQGIMGATQ